MVQTRSSKPSKPARGRAVSSKKRKGFVIEEEQHVEMQIQETSSQDKRQRVENVHIAFEEPEPEPEPGTGGVIVFGQEDVEESEIDTDDLVSDVLRCYDDVDVDTNEAEAKNNEPVAEVLRYNEDVDVDNSETEAEHTDPVAKVLRYYEDVYVDTNGAEAEDTEPAAEDVIPEKKIVHFNDKGQPIGEEAAPFTSYLGSIMRKHCPISYEKWRDVPGQLRDTLWKLVVDKYAVPVAYKQKVLDRIHAYWGGHKSVLRLKHYDSYSTDEERKRNCPHGVRQDHWNIFVDNESSPAAQARRKAGKLARQAMKTPHFTGRTGAARTEEALKKGNPLATVTRTDMYLAMHSPKDGSCRTPELTEKLRKIKAIAQQNPSSINLDLDHDPVAQVCGRERSGRPIRGLGMGVSKFSLCHSAHAREQLQQERRLRIQAEEQIATLTKQVVSQPTTPRAHHHEQQVRVSKSSLRHSALARHQLQQERRLRVQAEEHVASLKEQVASQPTDHLPVYAEEHIREQVVYQEPAPIVDQLGSSSAEKQISDVTKQVVYRRRGPRVSQLEKERRLPVSLEEQIAHENEPVVSQVRATRVDQPDRGRSCQLSAEEQIDMLRKQVSSQKEQVDLLLQERAHNNDLKKLIVSQGLMIADMRELIARLCS